MIRKALSYAKYMSEEQIMNVIQRITNSEMSNEGLSLDELITSQLNREGDNNSIGFARMYLDVNMRKNIYLHSDVPIGLKEYFIDTALDNTIEERTQDIREVNFDQLIKIEGLIMATFLTFCNA